MSATVSLSLKPWTTPNFAQIDQPPGLKQDGIAPLPSMHVSDLPPQALSDLAQGWLTELYAKAGKPHNWTFVPAEPPQP